MNSAFFSRLAHDLRGTASTAKMALLQLSKLQLDPSQQKFLDILDRNAQRLIRIADRLSRITQLENGKAIYQMDLFNLGDMIRATAQETHTLENKSRIELVLQLSSSPIQFHGDPDWLSVMIRELVSNAIVCARKHVFITLQMETADQGLFMVADDGSGFSLPVIIDRFESNQNMRGMGVSLPLVHSIAQAHHMDLEFTNGRADSAACGATVRVRFRLSQKI